MMRSMVMALMVVAAPLSAPQACAPPQGASSPRVYESRGEIKSFGPERHYANIHHDAIPGYMDAMTMSFEAGEPGQLAPFKEGQRVSFSFSDSDGRRVLLQIRPE
jgi:Cu/Ag efflux protein CusF